MIKLVNVKKEFKGVTVLQNVNCTFENGKTYAIIGSSGAGKSTLLRCINYLEKPTEGEVWHDDVEMMSQQNRLHEIREKCGMVFQNFNLFAHMRALDNVMFALKKVKKLSDDEAKVVATQRLSDVGLAHRLQNYPHQLSGGEKQRVAIARALAMEPKVMLFDEPTSALDPEMTQEVLKVMKGLNHTGMTIIIVTHEINFAKEVADEIIYMDKSEILEITDTKTFFASPKSTRAKEFLANMI
ncbi:MAG: amino acid ABC transporter ATP-binding protein [Erysipelotrichaceae bacterium]